MVPFFRGTKGALGPSRPSYDARRDSPLTRFSPGGDARYVDAALRLLLRVNAAHSTPGITEGTLPRRFRRSWS
jgi:hypothetical protein